MIKKLIRKSTLQKKKVFDIKAILKEKTCRFKLERKKHFYQDERQPKCQLKLSTIPVIEAQQGMIGVSSRL
jgi:hypothetical protein